MEILNIEFCELTSEQVSDKLAQFGNCNCIHNNCNCNGGSNCNCIHNNCNCNGGNNCNCIGGNCNCN